MKIKVDLENDALYFRLDDSKIIESEEVKPGIVIDYNEFDKIVGIEILHLQDNVSKEYLKKMQFETA